MKSSNKVEQSKGSNWPVAYRLAAYSAVGSKTVANLYAPPRRFDIAPGPLEGVLTEFGFQVIAANDRIQTLQSPGVTGVSFTFTDHAFVRSLGRTA